MRRSRPPAAARHPQVTRPRRPPRPTSARPSTPNGRSPRRTRIGASRMANGDIVLRTASFMVVKLLDAVGTGATNNGVWVDCADYQIGNVTITGGATTTVAD